MKRVMAVSLAQAVFFYYFMLSYPPTHISHLIFDALFDCTLLATAFIGALLNWGVWKEGAVTIISPLLGQVAIYLLVTSNAVREHFFLQPTFTLANEIIYYVALSFIWFGFAAGLKLIFDKVFG